MWASGSKTFLIKKGRRQFDEPVALAVKKSPGYLLTVRLFGSPSRYGHFREVKICCLCRKNPRLPSRPFRSLETAATESARLFSAVR